MAGFKLAQHPALASVLTCWGKVSATYLYITKSVDKNVGSSKNSPISLSIAGGSWDVCSDDLTAVKPLESTVLLEEQGLFGGEEGRAAR